MKWGWTEKESPKQKKYSTYKRTSYELALWLLHFRALKLQRVIRYFKGMWWPFLIFHSNSLSFFFFFLLIPHQGHWRCWSPSQDLLGEKKEYNLDRFSVHRTHTIHSQTHTPRGNVACNMMFLDWGRTPEKFYTDTSRTCKLHMERLQPELRPEPSCYAENTSLTLHRGYMPLCLFQLMS